MTPEMKRLLEEVEQLKARGRVQFMCIAALGVLFLMTAYSGRTFNASVAAAQSNNPTEIYEQISAKRFVLVDDNAKSRAYLRMRGVSEPSRGYPGPALEFINSNGRTGAMLSVADDVGGEMVLSDLNGTPRAQIGVGRIPTWLYLRDENGKERISLMVEAHYLKGDSRALPTAVEVKDKQGRIVWSTH